MALEEEIVFNDFILGGGRSIDKNGILEGKYGDVVEVGSVINFCDTITLEVVSP